MIKNSVHFISSSKKSYENFKLYAWLSLFLPLIDKKRKIVALFIILQIKVWEPQAICLTLSLFLSLQIIFFAAFISSS